MESLLTFADELERRDAAAAQALEDVERLQSEIDELRAHAAAAASFLAALPDALAERVEDERAAAAARERAQTAVREAEEMLERADKEDQRVQAARAVETARDDLHAAEFWVVQARDARADIEREGTARRTEGERLVLCAAELAVRVRDVAVSSPGLDGAVEWASRARGALILEHSKLVREREEIVREASELLASVSGDPFAAVAASGLRDRLFRAIGRSSS
jgi:hypothetical protein